MELAASVAGPPGPSPAFSIVPALSTASSLKLEAAPRLSAAGSALPTANVTTPPKYPGKGEVTADFVHELASFFSQGGAWPWEEASKMVADAAAALSMENALVNVAVPPGGHITVVGDVHGQLFDLISLIERNGAPGPKNPYVFNGDFVDRGSFSVETMVLLLAWKAAYPEFVHLARGNHEAHEMNVPYGFTGEVLTKYGLEAYNQFQEVFSLLPLAHVINKEVLVVHGGLPSAPAVQLSEIEELDRDAAAARRQGVPVGMDESEAAAREASIFQDLLWSDPRAKNGLGRSQRGGDLTTFGPDVTEKFLMDNGLRLVIRSHEVKDDGFEWAHDGKCLTVFSAPRYADCCDNEGAVVHLTADSEGHLQPEILTFRAVTRPAFYLPAMVYSPMDRRCRQFLSQDAVRVMRSWMQ
eukprot:TRINITY_DN12453_c0_g2_i2.p1 TRINITY_DN12453_c0_g2~~TRINITY_DN12453_c0_g2_i2.p1  ORF type:complete len:429 (+),score=100.93 TRINITY_DN12453_c0_g2_i2:54-1289(+)